jgi:chromosome segregation ATPase
MRLAGLFFLIICIMSGIGYWYYNDTQERIAILQENNVKLQVAVETNEQALESLQADYASAQNELTTLNTAYQAIRKQNNRLANKLQQIDLEAAAIANAEAIERAVNAGTVNAGRCFELLSGAELNEKERNAQDGIAFNKECPWFYDDYKSRGLLNETPTDTSN